MRTPTFLLMASLLLAAVATPAQAVDAPDASDALELQPGCPPRTEEREGPFGTNRVEQHHNCRVDITLNEGIICLGGAVGKKTIDVSGSTVTYYYCENPNQGGPVLAASAADPLGPCSASDKAVATYIHIVRNEDCSRGVEARGYIHCIWGTQMNTVGAGPVYVAYETCRQPYETSAQAQPCSEQYATSIAGDVLLHDDCSAEVHLIDTYRACERPLAGFDSHRIGTGVGPVTASVGYCLPKITVASAASAASADCSSINYGIVYASPDCSLVSIRTYECVWGGYWHYHTPAGSPVAVREYRCSPPASSDAPEEREVRVGKTVVTQCNPPTFGYYERVVDTDYVDVYVWRCAI